MSSITIDRWHEVMANRDVAGMRNLIAADAVFHSPVVHTPQRGKQLTVMYLSAAFQVFGNETFRYVREVIGPRDAVLEFELEVDGIHVNGVDMIRWNDGNEIVDFKVMLRPLQAVNVIHRKMAELLQARAPQPRAPSNRDRAVAFLQMIIAGKVREAYAEHVGPAFRHHNPWFKGDAESLLAAMDENNRQFPAKEFEVQRVLQDGNLVAVHSRLRHAPGQPAMAVAHIFRFEDGRIAEFWDLGQAAPDPVVNENGMF